MLRERARRLRRDRTSAERRLWGRLRDRQVSGAKFRRQQPIGDMRLIVELDGSQHATSAKYDAGRSAFLASRGYRVLRFWDNEVLKETEAVLERIAQVLTDPHPNALPPHPAQLRCPSPLLLSPVGRGRVRGGINR